MAGPQGEWLSRSMATVDSFTTMQQDEGVDPPTKMTFKVSKSTRELVSLSTTRLKITNAVGKHCLLGKSASLLIFWRNALERCAFAQRESTCANQDVVQDRESSR
jgi:hypothetical protein